MGLHHGWDKFDPDTHADFVRGGVPLSDFDEPKYRKQRRKSFKSKRKRPCAKSKTGEVCEFTLAIIKTMWYSKYNESWTFYKVMTCPRCGRHGAWVYGTSRTNPHI